MLVAGHTTARRHSSYPDLQLVDGLQHPADRAVTPGNQNLAGGGGQQVAPLKTVLRRHLCYVDHLQQVDVSMLSNNCFNCNVFDTVTLLCKLKGCTFQKRHTKRQLQLVMV